MNGLPEHYQQKKSVSSHCVILLKGVDYRPLLKEADINGEV
ncbi:hypothetical protein [Yersinia phage vB_YenM_P778]